MKQLIAILLFALPIIANANLILDPTGGRWGYTLVALDDLAGNPITGFDLTLSWDAGPERIAADFWDSYFVFQSCGWVDGCEAFASPTKEKIFKSISFSARIEFDKALLFANQSNAIASTGYLHLFEVVLCRTADGSSGCFPAPVPENLRVKGRVYGADGKVVFRVPEPSALALLGIGLAGIGFARRKREAIGNYLPTSRTGGTNPNWNYQ